MTYLVRKIPGEKGKLRLDPSKLHLIAHTTRVRSSDEAMR